MHQQRLQILGAALAALWHPLVAASAQERGMPGVSSPGVSASNSGYEVLGTLLSYGRNEAVVDIGDGKTFRITINGGTMLSVKGRTTLDTLQPGARVQISGNLSRDPRVIHDASLTLFAGTAARNSRSSGAASKRDASWLQFMGSVVTVSPLVVQADRDTKVQVESLRNGQQTPVGGQSFEIQLRGGDDASVSVEFGDAIQFAGDRPNARSFVNKNGVANYLTLTRVESEPAGDAKAGRDKVKKRRPNPPDKEKKPKNDVQPNSAFTKGSAAERFKSNALKQWNAPPGSNILLAFEESARDGLRIRFIAGDVDAAAEELTRLMLAEPASNRRFQVLGRFAATELGRQLVEKHKSQLERFIELRLKDSVFDRDPCYSDLDPSSGKSINQKVAEGTCVIYRPFQ